MNKLKSLEGVTKEQVKQMSDKEIVELLTKVQKEQQVIQMRQALINALDVLEAEKVIEV